MTLNIFSLLSIIGVRLHKHTHWFDPVFQGIHLWSSPVQSPLQNIIVDAVQSVVVTSDSKGTIKTWKGSTGEEVASFESGFSTSTLLLFNVQSNSFLMV